MATALLKRSFSIALAVCIPAIIVFIIINSNPAIFSFRKSGSFEYVRKGEALVDKDRFKDAIPYFEKAYQESPENEYILSSLVYVYTKYSIELSDSGDIDRSLSYIFKAYEVKKDTGTMQNLAVILSKKAVLEAKKDKWLSAVGNFTDARFAAYDSAAASKNLSIFLFNTAVTEYNSGNERIALTCLNESLLAREDTHAYEFLGDIYYRKTDIEKALFYWNKAAGLDPGSKQIRDKIGKATRESAMVSKQKAQVFPHFEIRYGKDLSVDSRLVSDILERAYYDVGKDLGFYPENKTVIFIYSQKEFREIFKLPDVVRAFYDGNIRLPYPDAASSTDEIAHYLCHEYTHAIVSAKSNNNCPIWFSEGLAVWEEFKGDKTTVKNLLSDFRDESKLTLASLEKAFKPGLDKNADSRLYYLLSYTVVKYITDTWSTGGIRALLARMGNGQHVMNAIDDEFLLSEKEFEKRWREYVRKKFIE